MPTAPVAAAGVEAPIAWRAPTLADVPALHGLSRAVGWRHRPEDWATVLAIGQGIVAARDGVPVGVALYWLQGAVATIGLVIVSPDCQGRGLGRGLMDRVLAGCGARPVLLNATPAGAPLYATLGFAPAGMILQHQGFPVAGEPSGPYEGATLRAATADDTPALIALHSGVSGMDRSGVLPAFLACGDGIVLERGGMLAGFALCRRFGRGQAIGPVIARDDADARTLIGHWLDAHLGEFVRVDLRDQPGLHDWLALRGLPQVETTLVMARGTLPAPALRTPLLYGLANQAVS